MSDRNTDSSPTSACDAFAPAEIARRLEAANAQRATMPARTLAVLGILGGLYIGLGGAMATLVLTDNALGLGLGRWSAGVAFSLGLLMLVAAGGELFTGNNLMVLAWASSKASGRAVVRNWVVVFAANAVGCVLLAIVVHHAGMLDGSVKATAVSIAEAKVRIEFVPAFLRGVLCNMLVCIAVWLSVAARSVGGKTVAIVFPISAFVALGFEHCVANLYLLPVGMLSGAKVAIADVLGNLVPVTLGNIAGGCGIAAAYWLVYLREACVRRRSSPAAEVIAPSVLSAVSGSRS